MLRWFSAFLILLPVYLLAEFDFYSGQILNETFRFEPGKILTATCIQASIKLAFRPHLKQCPLRTIWSRKWYQICNLQFFFTDLLILCKHGTLSVIWLCTRRSLNGIVSFRFLTARGVTRTNRSSIRSQNLVPSLNFKLFGTALARQS